MTAPAAFRPDPKLLWTPKRIGGIEIRNRFVLTGHGTAMVTEGAGSSQLADYYAERARGGVGLIMLGTQQVHRTSPGLGHLLLNYDDTILPSLRRLAEAIHSHGAKVFGYIGHFGAQAMTAPEAPWSASALYDPERGEFSHAMTEDDMAEIAAAHAAAAARNIAAGLDGIEVHGGHGLLLHQFLSPWTNKRTDAYGGSLDNRLRFPIAVIRAVRDRIGPDVPLGMRLSGDEAVPGGLTVEDMTAIVPRLVAAAGLDYVDVSAGNDRHAVSNMLHHPPMGLGPMPYAEAARAIRAVIDVPVIHGTRIRSAAVAQELLASGAADFAGFCRALIADPHLPNKHRVGRDKDTIPCVACEQACIGHLVRGAAISCVGNPVTGREARWGSIGRTPQPGRVVVVGAGPAGLEAAALAAARGHSVVLFERESEPGGLLRLAALAPGRGEWADLIAHKLHRLEALGVELRLSCEAEPAEILGLAPDIVILATGSTAVAAPPPGLTILGLDEPHVLSHRDALAGASVGPRVLVLDFDNHSQGIGTASFLAERGARVTIATAAPRVGHRLEPPNHTRARQVLDRFDVTLVSDFIGIAIEGPSLRGRHVFGGRDVVLKPFDHIVIAGPGQPRQTLATGLAGQVGRIALLGDCRRPRDVEAAILDANLMCREI